MIRTICAVLVLGLTTPAFTPALADTLKLASTYDEVGTNADGSKYTGTATVEVAAAKARYSSASARSRFTSR